MKDIYQGPVFEFLKNESLNNRMGWGGNAGCIDMLTENDLKFSKIGTTFMRETILQAAAEESRPLTFVETGTNYGSFSYLLYETLDEFKLYTCDYDVKNHSQRCVDFINSHYEKNNVEYYHTTGTELLQKLKRDNVRIDFAWLDSGHTYDCLMEELMLTKRLQPRYIMVDDFWVVKSLQNAVFDFIKNSNYRFYSYSNVQYPVGAVAVLKYYVHDESELVDPIKLTFEEI